MNGKKVSDTNAYPCLKLYWDGDLLSESYNDSKIEKWHYDTKSVERLATTWKITGCSSSDRGAPMFYGDILGDWREMENMSGKELACIRRILPEYCKPAAFGPGKTESGCRCRRIRQRIRIKQKTDGLAFLRSLWYNRFRISIPLTHKRGPFFTKKHPYSGQKNFFQFFCNESASNPSNLQKAKKTGILPEGFPLKLLRKPHIKR